MPFPFFGSSGSSTNKPTDTPTAAPLADPVLPEVSDSTKATPSANRYETVLQDEIDLQAKQYTTVEDVPACMTLLDDFLICYALVPQLRNLYRHGELHDCTWKFQDFKYCMSLKSEEPEAKRQLWIKRRAEWWAKRRIGPSSEDVWDVRLEKLENFPPLYEEVTSETSTP